MSGFHQFAVLQKIWLDGRLGSFAVSQCHKTKLKT